ncbi:MAG TPA: phage tail protein, partial [Geothrix sp.]|nr:phage tail protein [Geothrix sp.]
MNKWTLYQMAQICDGMVSDGLGGQEPRFTFNAYISSAEEAYTLLAQVAACARAQTYYGGGQVTPVQDVDRSPVALFTPANVKGGRFTYTGTARRARHTVCNVRWFDPAQQYREVPEMVLADDTYVARYGLQPQTLRALGCTSLGQARRFGRWSILSEMEEDESVAFSSGLEGIVARPGDIILIQDPARARVRLGGRLVAATTTTVTLDNPVTLQAGQTYTLWAQLQDGSVVARTVTTSAGTTRILTISGSFPTAPQAQAVWMLSSTSLPASRWSVLSVKENAEGTYDIVALANYQPKYASADSTDTLVARISDPLTCPAPTGLAAAHTVDRSHLDRLVYVLSATWTAPATTAPVTFQAQARLAGGPWQDMSINGCSAVLQDVEIGAWDVHVRGVYRWGLSDWTSPAAHTIANAGDSPAETALAGLAAVADDGTLSKGEKAGVILKYNTAVADYALLVAKAQATGASYSAYAAAYTALQSYLLGLSPAYSDVTQDTPINSTDWQTTWKNYYAASTDLLLKLAGAPPSAVDLVATTNWSLATNASAPVIDGVTSAAAQTVILAGQTTASQNGLYQIAYTPAAGGGYLYPTTGAYTYTGQAGTYTNGANAYDGTSGAPTTATYSTL